MRRFLLAALAAFAVQAHAFDPVVPGKALEFPRDYGAHPGHRLEWWYVTGHLESARGPLGFQVTFFRVRNPDAEKVPGRFSPRQVLFAHAALADVGRARFLHDQRIGRALDGLVEARVGDTGVRIDDWTLAREGNGYRARIGAEGFALDLTLVPTQPVMLQGDRGYSRKGPRPEQASYYYSEPQLRVSGVVHANGEAIAATGVAWLDHEWSSELLAGDASGWDWLGANLDDGGALTVFRIRAKDGRTLWATATHRPPAKEPVSFARESVEFSVRRRWKSPRTGTEYPVAMDVRVAERTYRLDPLLDDQELDARASTGTLYWEGAVRVTGAASGRGYLELTGYAERVPF
jgi:predicted secreted hydrolase